MKPNPYLQKSQIILGKNLLKHRLQCLYMSTIKLF